MKRVAVAAVPLLTIVVLAALAWFAWCERFGPVEVLIVNDGSQPVVVQLVEVSEVDRVVIAEWREHRLDPGQSAVESRDPSGDSSLQLRVVRDDGRIQQYTLRRYLGALHRLSFRLRLTEEGLAQAQVREGNHGEFKDADWDLE